MLKAEPAFNAAEHRVPDKRGALPALAGKAAPNGGFGVWWFCPPIPALAGNANR